MPSTPTVLNARSRRATHERNAAGRYYGVLPQVCSRSSLHSCSWLLVNHGTLPPNTHHTSRRSGEATYVASAQPLAHCTRPHLRRPPYRPARAGTCLQLAARVGHARAAVRRRSVHPKYLSAMGAARHVAQVGGGPTLAPAMEGASQRRSRMTARQQPRLTRNVALAILIRMYRSVRSFDTFTVPV